MTLRKHFYRERLSFYIYYANIVVILLANDSRKVNPKPFLISLSTCAFVTGWPATVGIKIEESEDKTQ